MSITNWTRLEPDTQTNVLDVDLAEGVTARLADPLWMLGRQWQMGELTGEDAASPVVAHLEASSYALTSVVAGSSKRWRRSRCVPRMAARSRCA